MVRAASVARPPAWSGARPGRNGLARWCCAIVLCTTLPADVIYLKNGKRISASAVREEGARVSYDTDDGAYSLPRSLVLRIEREEIAPPAASPLRAVAVPELPAPADAGKAPVTDSGELNRALLDELLERPVAERSQRGVVEVLLASVRHELQRGRADSAISLLQRGLIAVPGDPELALNYGVLLLNRQRIQEAKQWLTIASLKAGDSPEVWKFLGYAEYLSDRTSDAIRAWKKSVSLRADAEVQEMLARALRETAAETNHEQASSNHFTLRFEGKQVSMELRRGILETLEQHYSALEQQLGISLRDPIPVILYTEQEFRDVTRVPSWAGAVNDGRVRVPVDGLSSITPDLSRVLKHELAHSFVWAKTRGRCPAWLNEGLAQLAEGATVKGNAQVAALWRTGKVIPIQALHSSFTRLDSGQANVAYAESLAAVEYLAGRYGLYELTRMLADLGNGATVEQSLASVYRLTYADLTREIGAWLSS